jgi:predicted PurR-regulated permease PerM
MPASAYLRVPRWIQLVTLLLVGIAAWQLAGLLTATLVVFWIAALIALLLNPLVHRLVQLRVPRGLAVLVVYVAGFALLIGVLTIASAVVVNQTQGAARTVEQQFTPRPGTNRTPADDKIDELQRWLNRNGLSRIHVRLLGSEAVARIRKQGVSTYVNRAINIGQTVAPAVVTGIFEVILILVVSIYMLLSAPRLSRFVNRLLPPTADGLELGGQVQRSLVAYVRGQFIVSLIIGASAGIAMEIFGVTGIWPAARDYAIFFALWAMVTEVIPYVGPILGAVPAVVLALFDKPLTALWVGLCYLAIHQLEGHVVVPRVMGSALKSHPLAVIFFLLAGNELYGLLGALLALPTMAVVRAVYGFLRGRVMLEPWPRFVLAEAGVGLATGASPTVPDPPVESAAAASGDPENAPSDAPSIVPRPPHVPPGHALGPDAG